jgi:hypothetical protein
LTGCRGVAQPCNRGGAARRLGVHAPSLWAHAVSPWRAVLGVWLPFVSNLPAHFGFAGLHAQGRAGVGTNGGAAAAAAATDACGGAARAVKPGAALKPRGSRGPQRRLPLQD